MTTPPNAAIAGSSGRAAVRQRPGGHLAPDLEADDQEEEREQPLGQPFARAERRAMGGRADLELGPMARSYNAANGEFAQPDREQRREQQHQAR